MPQSQLPLLLPSRAGAPLPERPPSLPTSAGVGLARRSSRSTSSSPTISPSPHSSRWMSTSALRLQLRLRCLSPDRPTDRRSRHHTPGRYGAALVSLRGPATHPPSLGFPEHCSSTVPALSLSHSPRPPTPASPPVTGRDPRRGVGACHADLAITTYLRCAYLLGARHANFPFHAGWRAGVVKRTGLARQSRPPAARGAFAPAYGGPLGSRAKLGP